MHEKDASLVLTGLRVVRLVKRPELLITEANFVLPARDELVAVDVAARTRGAVLQLACARLWESQFRLGKSLPEIAGLFDSLYVSFYEARVWRHAVQQLAYRAVCVAGAQRRTAEAGRRCRARESRRGRAGTPERHTHQFALNLPNSPERFNGVRGDYRANFWASAVPGLATTEVTVAVPAIEWTHDEIVDAYAAFVASV